MLDVEPKIEGWLTGDNVKVIVDSPIEQRSIRLLAKVRLLILTTPTKTSFNHYVMIVWGIASRSIIKVTAIIWPSLSFISLSELVKESVVRSHHNIYKEVWSPVVGELLPVLQESINIHDR